MQRERERERERDYSVRGIQYDEHYHMYCMAWVGCCLCGMWLWLSW